MSSRVPVPAIRRRLRRLLGPVLILALVAGLVPASETIRDAAPGAPDTPRADKPARGWVGAVTPRGDDPAADAAVTGGPRVVWPAPGTARVDVTGRAARLGGLTIAAELIGNRGGDTVRRLRAEVLAPAEADKARVGGPLLRLSGDEDRSGRVRVKLGYGDFAGGFGGDYGSRLHLVEVPDCALTRPDDAACAAQRPVPFTNDGETDTLTADVDVSARGGLFAMVAADASAQGDYGATALAPSSKWSVAPATGAMSWSYPLRMPPVPGGLAPEVGLNYSSQAVDGRTSATNNQGSWIGEGFSYEPGYIERRYKPCSDDGHDNSAEQCWSHHNATIMLAGRSGELVKVNDNEWKISNDDGSKVERLTGATNGDSDGEHWKVTTSDGTQYFLGLNRLPGWTAGAAETASVWTAPVYGDDAGEPCYQATFANASCDQAWRWNLDYVRDRHDNVIAYYYDREVNHYAKGGRTDVNGTAYHRGGVLKRIDYGQRHNAVYTTNAPARVRFDTAERCLPAGAVTCTPEQFTQANAASWPDVPYDRYCAPNTRCRLDQSSVSFWTRKRMTKVTTEIRSGSTWSPVDSWSLTHLFTDNGDGSRTLWLNKIDHAGHVGGTESVPSVELQGRQLPNRIDIPGDHISPLIRFRLGVVYTDSGSQIDFNYAPVDCAPGTLPRPGESTRRCYPVRWNPLGADEPITDWFHKYVVAEVIESDRTGGAPPMVKRYEYLGDAAWRKSEPDGITEAEDLTWSEWRGYANVRVTGGDGQTMTTRTEHTFLRGMNGDPLPGGGTRSVTATDSTGAVHTDHNEFAGFELETTVFDGATPISKTVTTPWLHHTLTETRPWGTVRAHLVRPSVVRGLTALAAGGWRETKSVTHYETTYGRVTHADDFGDVTTAADDRCIRTEYAENPATRLMTLPKRVETVAVNCAATVDRATQVLSDDRTVYDGLAYGAAPTRGDPTLVQRLAAHNGVTATHRTDSEATFDQWGRPLVLKDAAGATTTTAYTQTDGLTTGKTEIGPLGFRTITEYHPAWGVPAAQVDANDKRVDLGYDPLGRLTGVWLADRPKRPDVGPSVKYSYTLRTDAVVVVKTEKLQNDGTYSPEYQLFDGHLRPRQKQTVGPDGGRMVADTFYTPTGQLAKTYATYYAAGAPRDSLLVVDNGDVDGQTIYRYDGADRPTHQVFAVAGEEKWQTVTTYGGDRVTVEPPAGGIRTTTIADARGQTTELRQYHGAGPPAGNFDVARYTYTTAGDPETVTDGAGNVWRYSYDQRGRKTGVVDPDSGASSYAYDDLNRLTSTTDARGIRLDHTYDVLGRRTATHQVDGATQTKLAEWKYDTGAKGYPYSAARFVNGKAYTVVYLWRDYAYRPTRTRYVIPDDAGNLLKGTYEFNTAYRPDGTLQSYSLPAAGGLPAEGVTISYDPLGRATGLSGASPYVTRTSYTQTNELQQVELSTGAAGAKKTWLTWTYEEGSNRLIRSKLDREGIATSDSDQRYRYDDAGSLLSTVDVRGDGSTDRQCFQADHLRRLTRAWTSSSTAADPCAGGPTATGVGGPDPYHHSYEYDLTGNRTSETIHGIAGAPSTTRDYTYPQAGQPQPHTLTEVTERTPAGDRLYRYGYDQAGNTTSRNLVGRQQNLTWDAEGRLGSVTENGQTTGYVYDADGSRLVRKEPNATTVYLPGMELRWDRTANTVAATRYYSFGGMTVAVRVVAGVQFLAPDHQGTAQASVDAATGQIAWRRTTPFGGPRGTQASAWPTERGFVGGVQDSTTGLVHLGARMYDPALGRFTSVDPMIDPADPQTMHGYAYANNNPTTFSDPDGLCYGREEGDFCPGNTRGPWSVQEQDKYVAKGFFNTPKRLSGGGGGGGGGGNPEAERAAREAEKAKQKLIEVAKALLKIAMDELGITAALDCFTTGDLGACAETALNVASSFVGGILGKIATKYGAPWKWKKAYELGKKITGLLGDLVGSVSSFIKNSKLAKKLGGGGGGCNSFTPDTRVLLANGKAKAIVDVDVGDKVLATDPVTGESVPKDVVATIVGEGAKILVDITIADGSTLVATHNHPFWVNETVWLDAVDLRPGDLLRTSAGTYVQVTAIQIRVDWLRVHNLTVADIHTYYVVAGTWPVLVHNSDPEYCQLPLFVLRDGETSTPLEIANSSGGPTGGSRARQADVRQDLLDEAGGDYQCWRCGQRSRDPRDMHLGHKNVPTSKRGNLERDNVCLEGAACNLSAGNRGGPSPGMSCAERGSCGAPYGR